MPPWERPLARRPHSNAGCGGGGLAMRVGGDADTCASVRSSVPTSQTLAAPVRSVLWAAHVRSLATAWIRGWESGGRGGPRKPRVMRRCSGLWGDDLSCSCLSLTSRGKQGCAHEARVVAGVRQGVPGGTGRLRLSLWGTLC